MSYFGQLFGVLINAYMLYPSYCRVAIPKSTCVRHLTDNNIAKMPTLTSIPLEAQEVQLG